MTDSSPPDLDPRFLPPDNWQWDTFTNGGGYRIRFGHVAPKGDVKGVVVGLQGLSEFCEKYFETAHDMLARGYAFWMMDWAGQGGSGRYLANPHKRHSAGFEEDLADFHTFVRENVKPAIDNTLPLVMLGHSMGGHIGLRYLYHHPGTFACAAFSAPMLAIHALSGMPSWLRGGLTQMFHRLMPRSYVFGGRDWHVDMRLTGGESLFSGDPVRTAVHNTWCLHDPALQVGNVTFHWLYEAVRSCRLLHHKTVLRKIDTPVLLALAADDRMVDNAAIRRAAAHMPQAALLALDGARHEILMEQDKFRERFFDDFDKLLSVHAGINDLQSAQNGKDGETHMVTWSPEKHQRLSDRILDALNLAIEQKDVEIAESLEKSLEMAMTRNAGGPDFVERREYTDDMEAAFTALDRLRAEKGV